MIGGTPRRPAGTSNQARWCQWVHDTLLAFARVRSVPGAKVSSTVGGVFIEPNAQTGGAGGSRVSQYLLTDHSAGDYFVCRTFSLRTDNSDPENPVTVATIGHVPVFIAKPPELR